MEEWQQAAESLSKGNYERIEQLLQEQQEAAQQSGQLAMAAFLMAASQICLTCQQLRFERDLHQQALESASQREREIRKQLATIVETLSFNASLDIRALDEALAASTITDSLFREQGEPETDKPKGLLHSIQQHLSPEPSLPVTQRIHLKELAQSAQAPIALPGHPVDPDSPLLTVYCLGQFQAYLNNQPVESWPSGKGKSILKYLVTHRKRPIAKEVLMELFWPEANSSAARNNLNVAVYALRQMLRNVNPDYSHILFQDDRYLLNPELDVWVDAEEFLEQYEIAQGYEKGRDLVSAIRTYSTAETLYRGEFFQEDRYEEWIIPVRRDFQIRHLDILTQLSNYYFKRQDYGACTTTCNKMLAVDSCLEDAHRLLMRCYSRQGQYYLALRQYHQCLSMLEQELEIAPAPQTVQLFEKIRRHEPV